MAVYQQGQSVGKGDPADVKSLKAGREYIFHYHIPTISFTLFSPETIASWVKSWFSLKQTMSKIDPSVDPLITVTGVYLDTQTGDMLIRATVNQTGSKAAQAAVVNGYAVLAVIAGIFAVIGFGVITIGVYEIGKNTPAGQPTSDPCSQTGVIATISCWIQKLSWVSLGVGVGVLLTLVFLLFLVGREHA